MTAVSGRENDSCVNHDVKVSRNEISREVVLHEVTRVIDFVDFPTHQSVQRTIKAKRLQMSGGF